MDGPTMSCTPTTDILTSLEDRQDELIRQLDELNQRIERTLARFAGPCRPPKHLVVAALAAVAADSPIKVDDRGVPTC
jgi:hypothetical protein